MKTSAELRSVVFRRERERTFRELEQLVARYEKGGPRALSVDEVAGLPVLYRAVVSSLSVARAISLDQNLIEYLEHLTARAYVCVYGAKRPPLELIRRFFASGFPRTVRAIRIHLALAAIFLFGGAITAFLLVRDDPELYYSFVAEELAGGRDPAASTEFLYDTLYEEEEDSGDVLTFFSSYLFAHNARIGLLSFAVGIAAGVLVFLISFTNGLMLGAFAALFHDRGLSVDLWGWLLPHGVTEILALLLCAAAGLHVGQAVVFPGRLARWHALVGAGRRAGMVVIGSIPMFLLAGLIEGIFRQTVTDIRLRYAVAMVTAAAWIAYFVFAGRRAGQHESLEGEAG